MVVMRLLLALALLAGPGLSEAFGGPPAFYLSLEKPRVEYGKALVVTLHARASKPSLGTLDLSPLARDFVVETPNGIQNDTARRSQSWRILLYPRRPGSLRIPSLEFLGVKTPAKNIDIAPARGRRDRAPIRVTSTIGKTAVWIGQPVRVTLRVTSDYPFALLGSGTSAQDGIDVKTLSFTQRTVSINGTRRTQYRIGWVLYPQVSGKLSLQLPAVSYSRDGIVTRRFFPPQIELHVHALPAFIPPTMPIGHVGLVTSLPQRMFFIEGMTSSLHLRIDTTGLPAPSPWQFLGQIKNTGAIAFYPPERLPRARGESAQAVDYRIPFVPRSMGRVALPTIRLQYFDPSTGKIVTRRQSLGEIISVSRWAIYASLIALLACATLLTGLAYRWTKARWTLYRAYRSAWHTLRNADTPEDMKGALMLIARAESWADHPTLTAWLKHWQTRYPKLTTGTDSVRLLQERLYGQNMTPLHEIRSGLAHLCSQRMPLLRALSHIRGDAADRDVKVP